MKRVGLIIPSVNTMVEDEMLRAFPPSIHPHVTRLRMTGPHRRPLTDTLPQIRDAASALVDAGCELVVFHCTANSTDSGAAGEQAILAAIRNGGARRASSTATALRRALSALGGKTLALITPYTQAMTDHETEYLREIGQTVVHAKGWNVGRAHYADMTASYWVKRLQEAAASAPNVYFLSCANIAAMAAIEPAERALGRPVISSNQVVVWNAVKELIGETRGCGRGQLFDTPTDEPA